MSKSVDVRSGERQRKPPSRAASQPAMEYEGRQATPGYGEDRSGRHYQGVNVNVLRSFSDVLVYSISTRGAQNKAHCQSPSFKFILLCDLLQRMTPKLVPRDTCGRRLHDFIRPCCHRPVMLYIQRKFFK